MRETNEHVFLRNWTVGEDAVECDKVVSAFVRSDSDVSTASTQSFLLLTE